MEYASICLTGIIGMLSGILGTYVVIKLTLKPDKILEYFDVILNDVMETEDTQKKIYGVGVLLGNGLKTGLGIQKLGGKMSMKNVIMQGIAGFLQSKLGVQQSQQTSIPTNVFEQKG